MCDHIKTKSILAEKIVAGTTFSYKTKECVNCGSKLWSQETENKFRIWLTEQKREHSDKFVIQKVAIPPDLVEFAASLASRHFATETDVYQACLAVFFSGKLSKDKLDKVTIASGAVVTKKFRVNPGMFIRIEADSKIYNKHMNEIASWVVQKVLGAGKAGYDQTLESIELVLDAA